MKTPLFLMWIILIPLLGKSQDADSVYKALQHKYSSLLEIKDSLIVITYHIKNRYTDSFISKGNTCVNLIKKMDRYHPEVYKSSKNIVYHFQNNSNTYKYKKEDSSRNIGTNYRVIYLHKGISGLILNLFDNSEKTKIPNHFDLKANQYGRSHRKSLNSYLWELLNLTFTDRGDFKHRDWRKPILLKYSKDMIILHQYERKDSKRFRNIYLNSNFEIIKIELVNLDEEDADEYWSFDFSYPKETSFDALNKKYKLGKYSDTGRVKPNPGRPKDTLNASTKVLHLLGSHNRKINDSLKTYLLFFYFDLNNWQSSKDEWSFVNKLYKHSDTDKIYLIGVDTKDNEAGILHYMNYRKVYIPQLDCNYHAPAQNIVTFPSFILMDSNFNVLKRWIAYGKDTHYDIEDYLKKMGWLKSE